MGSRCRGSTERQGSGKGSGTGRFVLAGSGSDAPEYAHSLHSTTEGAHRAGGRLRTIARRSVISRRGKIEDRKSTRLNSSHANISYAVFCLKKKNDKKRIKVRKIF